MYATANELLEKETKECCAPFQYSQWDNVNHAWHEKLFLKDSIPEFLHIPLPGTYPRAINRMWKIASEANAATDPKDFLLLAHDPSAFKAELYMSVTRKIEGHEVVEFTGNFFSKAYEAQYKDVPKCLRQMDEYLKANRMASKKYYIYYPYCPKCAEKYGHNYIVVLAEIGLP